MKLSVAFALRCEQQDAMTKLRGLFRLLLVPLCISLAQPLAALAQTNTPSPLPPAAQEALDKGIIAARVPDYLLAIRYFEEARKLAPQAPVVLLNMGLAESKIPGRELRAMAWFGAYLAAYPDAPNGAAVREQINALDMRNQSGNARLITSLQNVAIQSANFREVAKLWAAAGDITAAHKAANLTLTTDWKRAAQTAIAKAQIKRGDIADAQMTLTIALQTSNLIVDAEAKSTGQHDIAEAQIEAGDTVSAQKTLALALVSADLIGDANYKTYAQRTISETQIKVGDIAGAQKTLASALRTVDLIESGYDKSEQQSWIAETQIRVGDIPGAQKTLVAASKIAELIQDASDRDRRLSRIALVQIKVGDIAGAQKNFDLIKGELYRSSTQIYLRDARAHITNAPAALEAKAPVKRPVQSFVAVSDWLEKLENDKRNDICPLKSELFIDVAGYLKSLPPYPDNPRIYFDSLSETAGRLVDARNVIVMMLKQQAR